MPTFPDVSEPHLSCYPCHTNSSAVSANPLKTALFTQIILLVAKSKCVVKTVSFIIECVNDILFYPCNQSQGYLKSEGSVTFYIC